ncbi:hypothetical protein PsorP6_009947 [Peronosclerospora sorghi]|uniref:Uncharacterized protein n=1 Tax=Peronosclerospora sorghi TaxID=230839 RepID=A0ACC0VWL6_9STRA|nr:hypothetical protein PsorP6_009947 [Peronosclerospora sorghi]
MADMVAEAYQNPSVSHLHPTVFSSTKFSSFWLKSPISRSSSSLSSLSFCSPSSSSGMSFIARRHVQKRKAACRNRRYHQVGDLSLELRVTSERNCSSKESSTKPGDTHGSWILSLYWFE